MKFKILLAIILIALCTPAFAAGKKVMVLKYEFNFLGVNLAVKYHNRMLPGKLLVQKGDYVQWAFDKEDKRSFTVIVNTRTQGVIYFDDDYSESSGRLLGASADNKFVLLQYNDADNILEIRDANAKLVFKQEIPFNENAKLVGNKVVYVIDAGHESKDPAAVKACGRVDLPAIRGVWMEYDLKTGKTAKQDRPVEWICVY